MSRDDGSASIDDGEGVQTARSRCFRWPQRNGIPTWGRLRRSTGAAPAGPRPSAAASGSLLKHRPPRVERGGGHRLRLRPVGIDRLMAAMGAPGLLVERGSTRDHFMEDRPEREDVGRTSASLPRLARGHVRRGEGRHGGERRHGQSASSSSTWRRGKLSSFNFATRNPALGPWPSGARSRDSSSCVTLSRTLSANPIAMRPSGHLKRERPAS